MRKPSVGPSCADRITVAPGLRFVVSAAARICHDSASVSWHPIALFVVAATLLLSSAGRADALVYWANEGGSTIGRGSLDGADVDQSYITGGYNPCGVAVDSAHLYWTNGGGTFAPNGPGTTVGRANLDGTDVDQSFIEGASAPCNIAVDGAHIYWTNQGSDTIGRANLDGSGVNESFITTTASPSGLAVDSSHIYWTNFSNGGSDTVGRASLDGSSVNQSFITGLSYPEGVTVDESHIYWTNTGWRDPVTDARLPSTIGRANLDGSGANQSFVGGLHTALAVAVDSAHLYWGDFVDGTGGTIGRANLDGTSVDQQFITGASTPRGIAVDALLGSKTTITPSQGSAFYGGPLTFTATTSGAGPAPTGTADFTVTGEPPVPVPLDTAGKAAYDPPYYLDVGDKVAVDYHGDGTYGSSHTEIEPTIEPALTSVSLVASPNPQKVGAPVDVTATVNNLSTSITPFGSISVEINGGDFRSESLDDNGQAYTRLTPGQPGDYHLTLRYHDDTGFPADFTNSEASLVEHVTGTAAVPAIPAVTSPSPVQVVVGARPKATCTVPRLRGLRLAVAKRRLSAQHCKLGRLNRRTGPARLRGRIVSSRPKEGTKTARRVALVIGK